MSTDIGKTAIAVKQFEPTFHIDQFGWVIATQPDKGFFKSQSVEAHLLYAILQRLEKGAA
jgi:hypothetical protein